MSKLPDIRTVKLSFIKQFTLTNFVEKNQALGQRFSFLANSDDYSEYYKFLESSEGNSEKKPLEIDGLGSLMPLKRKHSLNSYWKSFRLPLINQEKECESNNELFFLLPLKIKIPVTHIKASNKKFPINFYVYLFPFGSCCINMEINISVLGYSLNELPELIANIKRSKLSAEKGSFEPFSIKVAKRINEALFADEKGVKENPTHTFIFLDTSDPIIPTLPAHKKVIAAAMKNKNIEDVSTITEEKLNEICRCKLKNLHSDEILLFNPKCTFICPSHIVIGNATNEKKIKRKMQCMYDNYCSFLNVIFAVNRFLDDSFIRNKSKLSEKRAFEIIKCFTTAFPEAQQDDFDINSIYFGEAFSQIAPEIKLNYHLKEIRMKSR